MSVPDAEDEPVRLLLDAPDLHTAAMVLQRPSPVPGSAGVYAWYFDAVPQLVPDGGFHVVNDRHLLYVGIAPSHRAEALSPSRQTIRKRIRNHYKGNASGSTLRLTLGTLLADELGLALRPVGATGRLTFGEEGERALSVWMAEHAQVVWAVTPAPWLVEARLIRRLVLPLNLDQNSHSPFHATLTALRAAQRERARRRPPIPG